MDEEYIRKSDVEKLINKRIALLKGNIKHGKALTNSIVNLSALKTEVDNLYSVKVKFKQEPPIWKKS